LISVLCIILVDRKIPTDDLIAIFVAKSFSTSNNEPLPPARGDRESVL
jgi:hypothetical protein